jgi:hypothetical protein
MLDVGETGEERLRVQHRALNAGVGQAIRGMKKIAQA